MASDRSPAAAGQEPEAVVEAIRDLLDGERPENEMLHSTGCSAPGYSKATSRSSSELSRPSSVTGFGGAAIDGSDVEHLLDPLRAHRRAGGAMTATNVASITDIGSG